MTISVSRRAVLKGTGAGFAASLFMHTAPTLAAETQAHSGDSEWTGYTICDSCNHMPMCGITFHAKGNTVIHIENWKEHSQSLPLLKRHRYAAAALQPESTALSLKAHESQRI